MTAATELATQEDSKTGAVGSLDPEKFPPRVIVTDGFERLFSHYTGLHGEQLLKYLSDFQTKALEVCS